MKKRVLSLLLAMCLVAALMSGTACVFAAIAEDGLEYKIVDDHVEITGYTGTVKELKIPAQIEGFPVTIIADRAIYERDRLNSIIVPDSVTFIGESAFAGCYSLNQILVDEDNPSYSSDDRGVLFDKDKTILIQAPGNISGDYVIPNSVITIGSSAFESCHDLISVNIPNSVTTISRFSFYRCFNLTDAIIPDSVVTIGESAFQYCNKLTNMTLGNRVNTIGDSAFYCCTNLTSITIPDSVSTIGNSAFFECSNLRSIAFPNSVTTIGECAFYGCHQLTSVCIPESITAIGADAFHECYMLEKILVDKENPSFSSDDRGVLFDKNKTTLIQAPACMFGEYVIPKGVTSIEIGAFEYCSKLTDVIIPDSVITINDVAFRCSKLTDVTIPDSTTTIGESAFQYCDALTSIIIGRNVSNIGAGAFFVCANLESVFFTGDAPSIGIGAFLNDTLTAFYPAGNTTWTADVLQDYGGTITWVPYLLNPFTDVAEGSFCYEPVLWAVENNITSGMGNGTFAPNNQCTRGQVVTFLWRAAGCPEPTVTSHPFTDVKEGAYYYKAMLWAVENKITSGMTATTFGPDAVCNRGQVVTFLHRAKGKPAPTSTSHPFTDVNEKGFYYSAMLWAVENKITSGMSATTFAPDNACTRGQVVTFLYRAYAK